MLYCLQCWHENNEKKKKGIRSTRKCSVAVEFPHRQLTYTIWDTPEARTMWKTPTRYREPFAAPHFVQRRWVWFQERFFPLLLFISCPTSVVLQRLTCLARLGGSHWRRAELDSLFTHQMGNVKNCLSCGVKALRGTDADLSPTPTSFFCLKQVLQSLCCTTIRALIRRLHVILSSMCSFLPVVFI